MPGALEKFAEIYLNNTQLGVIVGIGQIIVSKGKVVYYKKPTEEITVESLYNWMNGGNFMQPSSVFLKKAWGKCGPLDENLHIAND